MHLLPIPTTSPPTTPRWHPCSRWVDQLSRGIQPHPTQNIQIFQPNVILKKKHPWIFLLANKKIWSKKKTHTQSFPKQISHHLRLHSLHFWTPKERLPQNFLSPFRGPKRMLAVNCSAGRLPQMGPQPPQLRRHSWVESMRDSRNTSAKRGKTDSSWWFQPNWWESSPSRDKIFKKTQPRIGFVRFLVNDFFSSKGFVKLSLMFFFGGSFCLIESL